MVKRTSFIVTTVEARSMCSSCWGTAVFPSRLISLDPYGGWILDSNDAHFPSFKTLGARCLGSEPAGLGAGRRIRGTASRSAKTTEPPIYQFLNFILKDCRIINTCRLHISCCHSIPRFALFPPPCPPHQSLPPADAPVVLVSIPLIPRSSGSPGGSSTASQTLLARWSWSPTQTTRSARTRQRSNVFCLVPADDPTDSTE